MGWGWVWGCGWGVHCIQPVRVSVRMTSQWVQTHILAPKISPVRRRVITFDLELRLSTSSLSHDFENKMIKYGTSCCVRCAVPTILNGFLPHLAPMTVDTRGCVACKDVRRLTLTPLDIFVHSPMNLQQILTPVILQVLQCPLTSICCYGWSFLYLTKIITSMIGRFVDNGKLALQDGVRCAYSEHKGT